MSTPARIILVDDDPDLLRLVGLRLGAAGYEVEALGSAEAALNALAARRADLLLTDWRLPGIDGLELFEQVRQRYPAMPVILLTAHGTVPDAVDAVSRGVFGYLVKPFDGKALLDKVAQGLSLASPGRAVDQAAAGWRSGLVSRSPVMEELLAEARMVASTGASVLLRGESGTGKCWPRPSIWPARAPAKPSSRSTVARFRTICWKASCSAMKNSFTGASARQTGLVQQADGGTLFLDEIGDMPAPLQVKLLRVLQEREVRPVGAARATRWISVWYRPRIANWKR